ncbi:NCS2 family permease [Peptostreptococcus equinus]|uniref:NCS2 family permease n=1 Tax=Peptostreptococcus equinus TaxID=3003601 RepID=A0ABY7JQZ5_9FIRM|nr:NCS2 family permease [Peptostreptococcus sp. CBA3647]WAW15789.1 NCS2 family permease [Peptostreptococcus sp. CBA3647]
MNTNLELSGIQKLFPFFTNKNVDVKTEIIAGITTFLTMAYIIAVNPSILSATGMNAGALVTGTCLAAALGCFLMAFLANSPIALASGMGLNAFFAYTIVLKGGVSWQVALSAVFMEGIIFIFLTMFKVREAVVNSIPLNMKHAVTAGIGMFIAFLGLQSTGLIVANKATLVSLGHVSPTVLFATVGLIVIVLFEKKKLKGSILAGIAMASILAWGYALHDPQAATNMGIFLPDGIYKFESIAPIAGKIDFNYMMNSANWGNFFVVVCTLLFVDFFDTVGTLVGVCSQANMLDEDGNVPNVGRALMSDAIATTFAGVFGVSTITAYVESSTGVLAGGRTGYTTITVGILFLIAMFFSPIFVAIPGCATAPALIYVGYLMVSSIHKIDIHNVTEGLPAFITMISMVLTASIGDGLTLGILAYVIVNLVYNVFAKKEDREHISWVMIILAILFLLKLMFL